ncbi:MAG TPA: hypothetical protein PLX71_00085 [Phycicoccus sp.]|nr:hypothetical protein [Phycicoccus sp.]
MQASSLVFVVIVGVWSAYFLHHWARRREHLATAHTVDALRDTMRVLAVRDVIQQATATHPPRSYAGRPTRPVRSPAQVVVAEAGGRQAAVPPRAAYRVHVTQSTRGLTLVVGCLGLITYAVFAGLGVLRPIALVVPALLAIGGFLWVRTGVRAHQQARGRDRVPARRQAARATPVSHAVPESTEAPAQVEIVAEPAPQQERGAVYDIDVLEGAVRDVVPQPVPARVRPEPLVDEDDMPLTWDPVPVPRPTYTMKAKATRVAWAAPNSAVLGALGDADDDIPDAFPARRAVGG